MPPGANSWRQFRQRCISCWSCVQACPVGILHPSDTWWVPLMNYEQNHCRYSCKRCGDSCPTNAIRTMTLDMKKVTRVGISARVSDECYFCGTCADECPTGALVINETGVPIPKFDESRCVGCGACAVSCPVRAYEIRPLARQEIIHSAK
jgi:ferredoxin